MVYLFKIMTFWNNGTEVWSNHPKIQFLTSGKLWMNHLVYRFRSKLMLNKFATTSLYVSSLEQYFSDFAQNFTRLEISLFRKITNFLSVVPLKLLVIQIELKLWQLLYTSTEITRFFLHHKYFWNYKRKT